MLKFLLFPIFLFATCAEKERPCPTIPVWPQALINFDKSLPAATYDVEVMLDGKKESCTLTIGPSAPAVKIGGSGEGVVQGPMTKTETTCSLISIDGIKSDGSIQTLKTNKPDGKSEASFSLKMSVSGTVKAETTETLKFVPTDTLGPGCGRTDVASISVTLK